MDNKKLIYVLPSNAKHTHFSYNVEFLRSMADTLDIFLIIEKGEKLGEPKLKEHAVGTNQALLRILKTFFLILRARAQGYGKIYIHYSFAAVYCAFLVKILFLGKLKIYYWNCGMPWEYKRSFLQETYESLSYKLVDFLVTGGESLIDGYSEYYKISKNKIIIIQNWVEQKEGEILNINEREDLKKSLHINVGEKVLLHVHRLGKPWGAHNIIPIARNLKEKNLNFKWIIIGSGPMEEEIKNDIQKFALHNNMIMLGYIPNAEVKKYLQIADCFVLPSETEGMPRALLEAIVYSLPSAAFAVGTVPDILKTAKLSVPVEAGNIDMMGERIEEIIKASEEQLNNEKQILANIATEYSLKNVEKLFLEKLF
jgi:glycosyltransferase involved in cell wall biosynthesis